MQKEKPEKNFEQLSKQFSNHMSTDDADKGIFELVDLIDLGDQEKEKLKAMLGEAVFCYMTVASFQSYLEKSFDEIQEEVKLYSDEVSHLDQINVALAVVNNNNKQNFNVEDLPDPSEIHEHITGMLDGKLGNLAKEIAAETAEEQQ